MKIKLLIIFMFFLSMDVWAFDCSSPDVSVAECNALNDMYGPLGIAGSSLPAADINSWGETTDNTVCDISRITCDSSTPRRVTRLHLVGADLRGTIPDLSAFTNLQDLWLANNQLIGHIPDLSALANLQSLDLQRNQLSGPIPDLSALTNLQRLFLHVNQLTGPITELSAVTSLQRIYLQFNNLSGPIPDLNALDDLQQLSLDNNYFFGEFPDLRETGLQEGRTLGFHTNCIEPNVNNLINDWVNARTSPNNHFNNQRADINTCLDEFIITDMIFIDTFEFDAFE